MASPYKFHGKGWRIEVQCDWEWKHRTLIVDGKPAVYRTRRDALNAWHDGMPGRNDRARFVEVELMVVPVTIRERDGTTWSDSVFNAGPL